MRAFSDYEYIDRTNREQAVSARRPANSAQSRSSVPSRGDENDAMLPRHFLDDLLSEMTLLLGSPATVFAERHVGEVAFGINDGGSSSQEGLTGFHAFDTRIAYSDGNDFDFWRDAVEIGIVFTIASDDGSNVRAMRAG